MRKLLCLLMAILLIGTVALAESIDLSALSDNELTELKRQVDDAVYERELFTGTFLPAGKYITGSDIKAGKYIVHTASSPELGFITVYASVEDCEAHNSVYNESIEQDAVQHFFISLEEGYVLNFEFVGSAYIEPTAMIE